MKAPGAGDWDALAAHLDAAAEELMAAVPNAPDETERTLMELQAVSIRHVARRVRLFPQTSAQPRPALTGKARR